MQSGGNRQQFYDRHRRNPQSKQFYNSIAWRGPSGARTQYIREHPICERCNRVTADHVHHKTPLNTPEGWEARLDPTGFMSVCVSCHNIIEAQIPQAEPTTARGTLQLTEDETYYYDAEAADKPCRFISKFCRHYEGKWAGQPFTLLDWQTQIIRDVFGWKRRADNLRRFRQLYLISSKGGGKTPLLAALGLYMLLGDNEAGAHVISMASSFEQANLTFDGGKKYIAESEQLSQHPDIAPKQYIIEAPKYSKWTIVSGKPNGRSGSRPSCVIADEVHEWPAATGIAFDMLCANLFKRSQPLLLIATNAGPNKNCYAWKLHEHAAAVLEGTTTDPTLYPAIFETPRETDWQSEDAARAANPSMPDIVSFDQIKPEQARGEARYRRLYLSQWVSGSNKWLDIHKYDECVKPIDPNTIKKLPRYVGIDLSNGDDLCAQVDVYASQTFYVTSTFWLPQATADKYEQKNLHPYSQWAEQGAIQLLEQPTISIDVQTMIAQSIIDSHKLHPIEAVCFDTAYSSGVIPLIEKAGIKTIKVRQGWTLSAGCEELDRRLIEKSIQVAPNGVMRFCAENVEVTHNQHGQYWPVKEGHRNRSPGKASCKIDGVSALCTALTEARKHIYAQPEPHIGAEAFNLD